MREERIKNEDLEKKQNDNKENEDIVIIPCDSDLIKVPAALCPAVPSPKVPER